ETETETLHAPTIIPPRLEEAVILPYPPDAPRGEGSVEVVIRLAIDGLGAFVAAEVQQGAGEPFDSFALSAARHLRFAPATADGVPTGVTVELPIRFVLPPAEEPAAPGGVLVGKVREAGSRRVVTDVLMTMAPAAGGAGPDQAIETRPDRQGGFRFLDVPPGLWKVTISGHGIQTATFSEEIEADLLRQVVYRVAPSETGTRTVVRVRRAPAAAAERVVEGEWIREAAGSSGGFLRVLESEAAVAPTPVLPSGLLPGAPLIRGAEGADSAVRVDGIETPLLYHFGLLTTVVNGDLIDHVRLTPGGAGADHGDHIGGVVDVGLRPPRSDRFGGVLDISPVDAAFMLETPIGKHVGVYAAVRRSYVDLYLGKLLPEDLPAEVTAMPVYTDLAAMVNLDPGKGHRVAVSLITSSDKMEMSQVNTAGTTPLAALSAGFTLVHG
ncbi:MAG: TonB family protein, partial [Myxococcota bacterium]|nr:TonB family protein [Myxococcota bacterium]